MEIWQTVMMTVFVVLGLIQWAKGLAKKAPSWVWAAAFPPACFLLAAAIHYLPTWVTIGLLVWSLGQLGYENLLQVVRKWITARIAQEP